MMASEKWSVKAKQMLKLLIIGCLPQLLFGNIFVFPTYMNVLKLTLNLNQHEVELLAGTIALSFSLGVPAAYLFGRFGPKPTLVVALLVTCIGYISGWAVKFIKPGSVYAFPILLASFLADGHGGSYTYIVSLVITCRNFGDEHQGKIISFLEAAYSVSPIINQQVYLAFFVHGEYRNYNKHDVYGFFMFSAVFSVIVNAMCLICVLINDKTEISTDASQQEADPSRLQNDPSRLNSNDNINGERTSLLDTNSLETSCISIVKKLNTHLLFWTTVLGLGITVLFELNISVFTESLKYNHDFNVLFICYQTCAVVSRVVLGFVADALAKKVSCMVHLAVVSVLTGIAFLLASVMDMSLIYYYILVSISGVMLGVVRPVTAITMKRRFSEPLFASTWTLFVFCSSCLNLIFQQILSTLYQMNIPDEARTCYGQQCLEVIFILFSALCFLIALISVILTFRAY